MGICFRVTECSERTAAQSKNIGFGLSMFIDEQLVKELSSVTTRRVEAEQLAKLLNENDVAAVHFYDIVLDWITERAML